METETIIVPRKRRERKTVPFKTMIWLKYCKGLRKKMLGVIEK